MPPRLRIRVTIIAASCEEIVSQQSHSHGFRGFNRGYRADDLIEFCEAMISRMALAHGYGAEPDANAWRLIKSTDRYRQNGSA